MDRHLAPPRPHRIAKLHTLLEPRKAGDSAIGVEGHDLAVEDGVASNGGLQCLDQLRVGAVQRLAVPGKNPDAAAVHVDEGTNTVQLGLVDPLSLGRKRLGEGGQHWRYPGGLGSVAQSAGSSLGQNPQRLGGHALWRSSKASRSCLDDRIPAQGSPSFSTMSGTVWRVKSVG